MRRTLVLASILTMAGCSGSSSSDDETTDASTTTSDETTTEAYSYSLAPSSLALSIPESLTSGESGSSLRLVPGGSPGGAVGGDPGATGGGGGGGEQQSAPGTSESQGYNELSEKIQRVVVQVAELSLFNAVMDQIYVRDCGGALTDGACTVANPCVKITKEMMKSLEDSLGEEHFGDEGKLDKMDGKVDAEECLESVTINNFAADDEGYTFKAVMQMDTTNSMTQWWNDDKSRVKVVNKFQDDFGGYEEAPPALTTDSQVFKGNSTFVYDATNKTFKSNFKGTMTQGSTTNSMEETFTLQSLDDKLDTNGIVLKGRVSDEFGGNTWQMEFEGKADNEGGFVRTESNWSTYEVSAATLSAECSPTVGEYWLYPSGTTAASLTGDKIWHSQIGSVSCWTAASSFGSESTDGSINIYGQIPSDPTSMVLFEVTFPSIPESGEFDPDQDFSPTLTLSDLTISTLTAAASTDSHCYEEQFTSSGELNAWRAAQGACDASDIQWIGSHGTFGTEYAYDPAVDGEGFVETSVTLSGVTESEIQTASGFTDFLPGLFIFPAGFDPAAVEAFSEEFHQKQLGGGWPTQPDATASTSGIENYQIDYWGAADQAATAVVLVEKVDSETGETSLVAVSGATLTVD